MLLFPQDVRGLLAENAAVTHYSNGTPFTADNYIAVEDAAPDHLIGGLPYTASNKLSVEAAAPQRIQGGLPLTTRGSLAIVWDEVPLMFLNGRPFKDGKLCLSTSIPPIGQHFDGGVNETTASGNGLNGKVNDVGTVDNSVNGGINEL